MNQNNLGFRIKVLIWLIPPNLVLLFVNFLFQLGDYENSPSENIQVLFLFLSMLIFIFNYMTCQLKTLAFIGAFVCFSFILREVDVEDLDIHPILIFFGSGFMKNIILFLLFAVSIMLLRRDFRLIMKNMIRILRSDFIYFITLTGLLLVCSWIFDKHIMHAQSQLGFFLEELAESNAYILIFFSSIFFYCDFAASKKETI